MVEKQSAQMQSIQENPHSYSVTPETKTIVQELQRLKRENLTKETIALRRQLSDALSLPPGYNIETLDQEIIEFGKIKRGTITPDTLIRYGMHDAEHMDNIMAQASPEVQRAYQEYRAATEYGGENKFEMVNKAGTNFKKICDEAAGISEEELQGEYREYEIGRVFSDIENLSIEDAQALILQDIWEQISIAGMAQSVYKKRGAFIRDLALKAGLVICKKTSSVDIRPLIPGEILRDEREDTIAASKALVEEAIERSVTNRGLSYFQDNLRSPQITKMTFESGIPDTSEIVIDETPSGELGRGAIGRVIKATAKGGIPGLRKDPLASQDSITIVLKSTEVDPNALVDYGLAPQILSVIEEGYVLGEIRKKQKELYPDSKPLVPDCVLIQHYLGTPALAMEYLDNNSSISNQKGTLSPEQFRSACIQYFQLQDVIHRAGFTCGDKKAHDLHFMANEGRLVVLDWNVTTPIKTPPTSGNIAEMNNDILFGLKTFKFYVANAWSSGAVEMLDSLEKRVQSQRTTEPFDPQEVIKAVQAIQL